ncbi:hypothetical protein EDD15DRAFT_2516408 [Pisolithus albus]|nr:hypothetical protein EDD15DRAFT_2516408 [Pisolithus albus]
MGKLFDIENSGSIGQGKSRRAAVIVQAPDCLHKLVLASPLSLCTYDLRYHQVLANTHRASVSTVLADLNGRWHGPALRLNVRLRTSSYTVPQIATTVRRVDPDGRERWEPINCDSGSGHFSEVHGIVNLTRKGCGSGLYRHNYIRHIWEHHLGHDRTVAHAYTSEDPEECIKSPSMKRFNQELHGLALKQ